MTANREAEQKISIQNVRRTFQVKNGKNRKKREEFVALDNFSLDVAQGSFLTIVGPSGCGKSTLLDLLAGLSHPTSGEIYIDNEKITGPALNRGIVLQGYALFPWRTIRQNIEFGLEIKKIPKAQRREISDHFIHLVGLDGFDEHYAYELSGGMKQRVAIARALAYDPEVLLMDEPFAAVDAQTREVLQEELLRIWDKTGKTIVFITHSIDEAVFLADRVAVMSSNPGTLRRVIDIDLPRPRVISEARQSPQYNEYIHEIWEILHGGENAVAKENHFAVDTAAAALADANHVRPIVRNEVSENVS